MSLYPEPHTVDCSENNGRECDCGAVPSRKREKLPTPVVEILKTVGLDPSKVSGDNLSLDFLGPRIVSLHGEFVIVLNEEQRKAVASVLADGEWEPPL